MRNSLALLMICSLLTACYQSNIQARYVDLSDDCRDWAEEKQASLGKTYSKVSARNAELVTLFSDCMAKKGWQVATPEREAAPAGAVVAKPKPKPKPEEKPAAAPPPQQQPAAQTAAGPPASESTAAPANISPQPAAANPVASSGVAPPLPGRYYPAEQFK